MPAPLDVKVLEAAAQWYVDLREDGAEPGLQAAHQHWLTASPSHQLAWARVQRLEQTMGRVDAGIARPTLAGLRGSRREVLKVLSLLLAAGGSTYAWQALPWRSALAEHRTDTGERRRLILPDGTRLTLNTSSSADVRYSEQLREVFLHCGEIAVETAVDSLARPFIVHSPQGSIRALGTRFLVRNEDARTRVDVQQHAVEIRPAEAPEQPLRLEAEQQVWFSATQAEPVTQAVRNADAWINGLLVVSDWRLEAFIDELSRYHPGHLSVHPAVAELRISGMFQLGKPDSVLDNVAATLPIRVRRFTRYWARLEPR
ncbi:FecR domain-containing protein [Pseudomonas sp.]|uniref:FecR domain-containing protein n=1 Tax=Pseudomonas sp. TaxID=306 RepID=UPI003D0FF746